MSSSNPKQRPRAPLLTRFGRGFSPSRWLRRTDGLQRLSEGGNGQEWVLARGYCTYTVLDGAAVPSRKRRGFVDMAVSRWSPFADPQSHVEWIGNQAMVWAWSRASIQVMDETQTPLPAPRRVVPESLYRGHPQTGGEELVALDDGFEGRAWQQGVMTASRWWADVPLLQDWNEFRRGAGLAPASLLPEVLSYTLGERAWTTPRMTGFGEALGQHRNHLGVLAAGVAAVVLSMLLMSGIALKVSIWQLDQDIAAREQALNKIIAARERALRGRTAVDAQLALRPPAGQVELLALVGGLMRGNWQLQEWKLADAQTLQVTAKMQNADPRAIVSAWEDSKRFTEVTAEVGRQADTVVVKARILRGPLQAARR